MRDSMQQEASSFESSVQSELHKTETELNKSVEAVVGNPSEIAVEEPRPQEPKAPEQAKAG
jgi:hypothetical protein